MEHKLKGPPPMQMSGWIGEQPASMATRQGTELNLKNLPIRYKKSTVDPHSAFGGSDNNDTSAIMAGKDGIPEGSTTELCMYAWRLPTATQSICDLLAA
jgi:hypothetical protein